MNGSRESFLADHYTKVGTAVGEEQNLRKQREISEKRRSLILQVEQSLNADNLTLQKLQEKYPKRVNPDIARLLQSERSQLEKVKDKFFIERKYQIGEPVTPTAETPIPERPAGKIFTPEQTALAQEESLAFKETPQAQISEDPTKFREEPTIFQKALTRPTASISSGIAKSGENLTKAIDMWSLAIKQKSDELTKDNPEMAALTGERVDIFHKLSEIFGKSAKFYEEKGLDPKQGGLETVLKYVYQGVGQAAVDIAAIHVMGLPQFSAAMGGAQGIEQGKGPIMATAKGFIYGLLLHGILKGVTRLPMPERVLSGGAVFGGPSLAEELQKPEDQRDWAKVASDILIGAGLTIPGKRAGTRKELLEDFKKTYKKDIDLIAERLKAADKDGTFEEKLKDMADTEKLPGTEKDVDDFIKEVELNQKISNESDIKADQDKLIEKNKAAEKTPDAEFAHFMDNPDPGGPPIPMFTVIKKGETKTTVDAEQLIEKGFKVPEIPKQEKAPAGEKKPVKPETPPSETPTEEPTTPPRVSPGPKTTVFGEKKKETGKKQEKEFERVDQWLNFKRVNPKSLGEHGINVKENKVQFLRFSKRGAKSLDDLAKQAVEEGVLPPGSVGQDLIDAARAKHPTQKHKTEDFGPEAPIAAQGEEVIRAENLKMGDELKINGEDYYVKDKTGLVVKLMDGIPQDIPLDGNIAFDAGTLIRKSGKEKPKIKIREVGTKQGEVPGQISFAGSVQAEAPKGKIKPKKDIGSDVGMFEKEKPVDKTGKLFEEKPDIQMGDRVVWKGEEWGVGFVNTSEWKGTVRLSKGGAAGSRQENRIPIEELKIIKKQGGYPDPTREVKAQIQKIDAALDRLENLGLKESKDYKTLEYRKSEIKGGVEYETKIITDEIRKTVSKKSPDPTEPKIKKPAAEKDKSKDYNPPGEGDTGGYAFNNPSVVELPEIVEFMNEIAGGKFPSVKEFLGKYLGVFRHKSGQFKIDPKSGPYRVPGDFKIDLKHDIFRGPLLKAFRYKEKVVLDDAFKSEMAEKFGFSVDELSFFKSYDKKTREHVVNVYRLDPTLAPKVLAHEIGHLVDYLPQETLKRGNILGHIASLKRYTKTLLEEFPGALGKVLSSADRSRIRAEANRMLKKGIEEIIDVEIKKETEFTPEEILEVWRSFESSKLDPKLYEYIKELSNAEKKSIVKDAMKGKLTPGIPKKEVIIEIRQEKRIREEVKTPAEIAAKYKELIQEEIEKRRLYQRDVIKDELKELTQIWKPFYEETDRNYTKYRYSNKELYADAFSVLINNPSMLKDVAPSFEKAFFNYLERKPVVKATYERIQGRLKANREEILANRHDRIRAMFEKGEEEYREVGETFRDKLSNMKEGMIKGLVDVNRPAYKKIKEAQKTGYVDPEKNPQYWIEEMPYISSEMYQYLRDIDTIVKKKLLKSELTEADIGEYLFSYRVATERKELGNPLGITSDAALEQMGFLRKKLGDNKFNDLVDIVKNYRKLRKEKIDTLLEKSEMYDEELMKIINDNDAYATFDVQKYIEKRYGRGVGGKIYKQIGTLNEITNPFTATLMKDAALMRAAERKMIIVEHEKFMREHFPDEIQTAETKWNGEYMEIIPPKDPAQGMVVYLHKGKVKGFYMDKEIADTYNRDPYEVGAIYKVWQGLTTPFKELFVGKNVPWSFWNLQRDIRGTATKLPGAKLIGLSVGLSESGIPKVKLTGFAKHLIKALPDTWKDVARNESTDFVREMYEKKELLVGRYWQAKGEGMTHETQFEKMMLNYSLHPQKYKNVVTRAFSKFWDLLDKPGKMTERLVKIAGKRYARELYPNMGEKEMGHLVRSRIGSPDFYRRGAWYKWYNNVFLFSNAGKEGWRASYETASKTPLGYMYRVTKYDIMPKLIMYGAGIGLMGVAMKELMDKIPEHDKTNYITIPLGETESGKAVYLVMPHDFTGQVIAGMTWKFMGLFKNQNIADIFDYTAGGLPYSGLHPLIGASVDAIQYASGKNPYDEFRGKYAINELSFEAGGAESLKQFLTYEANQLGASTIYRFKNDEIPKIQTEIEKALRAPFIGSALRRFIRVSDRGLYEKYMRIAKEVSKTRSQELKKINRSIIQDIKKESAGIETAGVLFEKLKADGLKIGRWSSFYDKYSKFLIYKSNNAVLQVLRQLRTNEEKAAVLSAIYEQEISESEVKSFSKDMKYNLKLPEKK